MQLQAYTQVNEDDDDDVGYCLNTLMRVVNMLVLSGIKNNRDWVRWTMHSAILVLPEAHQTTSVWWLPVGDVVSHSNMVLQHSNAYLIMTPLTQKLINQLN